MCYVTHMSSRDIDSSTSVLKPFKSLEGIANVDNCVIPCSVRLFLLSVHFLLGLSDISAACLPQFGSSHSAAHTYIPPPPPLPEPVHEEPRNAPLQLIGWCSVWCGVLSFGRTGAMLTVFPLKTEQGQCKQSIH